MTVYDLAAQGLTIDQIAAALGIHRTTVSRRLRRLDPRPRGRPSQGRTVQVWTRLSPDEAARVERAAAAAGVTEAAWIRTAIMTLLAVTP